MALQEAIKNEMSQPLNLIASIVTLVNFSWSLYIINSTGEIPVKGVPIGSVEIGLIFSFALEVFLATFFGWLIVYSSSKGSGLPYLLAVVVMLISAWTSLFNIQWLIIGHSPSSGSDVAWLAFVGVFFCGFACYLINSHLVSFKLKLRSVDEFIQSLNGNGGLYIWQIFSFLLMFGVITSKGAPYY